MASQSSRRQPAQMRPAGHRCFTGIPSALNRRGYVRWRSAENRLLPAEQVAILPIPTGRVSDFYSQAARLGPLYSFTSGGIISAQFFQRRKSRRRQFSRCAHREPCPFQDRNASSGISNNNRCSFIIERSTPPLFRPRICAKAYRLLF